MTIEAGNVTTQAPALTGQDIVNAVIAGVTAQPQAQAPAPVARVSAFQALRENIKEEQREAVDLLYTAIKEDLEHEYTERYQGDSVKNQVQSREAAALDYIEEEIIRLYDGDDNLGYIVDVLKTAVAKDIANPEGGQAALRSKIVKGLPKADLKQLVATHSKQFDKVSKRENKSSGGLPGVSGGASAGQASVADANKEGDDQGIESLSPAQRDWYSALMFKAEHLYKSHDEAHKAILASAKRTSK